MMTSGVQNCKLQYRSVPIRIDGTGLLEASASGKILWSDWATDSNYTMTDCAVAYTFTTAVNTAYMLRFQVVDAAGRESQIYISPILIYNLDSVYRPGFFDLNNNVPVDKLPNNIITVDCISDNTCDGETLTLPGSLATDTKETEYEICLTVNDAPNATVCITATSSTDNPADFEIKLDLSLFPEDRDVFIGGILSITNSENGETNENPVNIIIYIKRSRPAINRAVPTKSFVMMRNGVFN